MVAPGFENHEFPAFFFTYCPKFLGLKLEKPNPEFRDLIGKKPKPRLYI